MKPFMSPKILVVMALIFSVLIVCFNVCDSNNYFNTFREYTMQDIMNMKIDKVNINTATKQELCKVPGIGDAISQEIIDYREKNGNFEKLEDLLNLKSISKSKLEEIIYYITV